MSNNRSEFTGNCQEAFYLGLYNVISCEISFVFFRLFLGKIPSEAISDYARLPLVELPVTVRPQSASSKSGTSESTANLATVEKTEVKSPTSRKDKGTKTPEPVEAQEEEPKSR